MNAYVGAASTIDWVMLVSDVQNSLSFGFTVGLTRNDWLSSNLPFRSERAQPNSMISIFSVFWGSPVGVVRFSQHVASRSTINRGRLSIR